ncbi:hypothetical protein M8J76_014176 [Diaphorina citri]|nr:hypothetical protein M8J76_014176 [Diaphorina citri]
MSWEGPFKPKLYGKFACDVCGKEYQYYRNLYRHKKFECGQEPRYQCPQCPYRTKQKDGFPTDSLFLPSPFGFAYGAHACDNCGKLYSNKANVRRHKRDECGGQQPRHQCPQCSYVARQKATLVRHMRFKHEKES